MSNIYYTSDPHVGGHKLVAELRGFTTAGVPDPVAHDEAMSDVYRSILKPGDRVRVLGDVSINGNQLALDWFNQYADVDFDLIAGNHDPVHPMDRRSARLQAKWLQTFSSIQPFLRLKLYGHNFMLSHFPYWPHDREGIEPRYQQYRLPNLGLPLLHGHTHSEHKFEFPNSLHVGWDAWGTLVPQEFVMDWLQDNAARQRVA